MFAAKGVEKKKKKIGAIVCDFWKPIAKWSGFDHLTVTYASWMCKFALRLQTT